MKHSGIVFKFPFDTQKQTYPFWDLTLRKPFPMVYQGTETLDGVRVYKFVQTIKPAPSARPQQLNANAMDLPGPLDATVKTQNYYSNVRTVWVEPNTGVIIKGQEQQYNTIRAAGADRVVITAVTIGYNAESVKMLADTYGPKGARLHLVRTILPIVSLIAGIVLVLAGLGLSLWFRTGRRRAGARRGKPGPAAT